MSKSRKSGDDGRSSPAPVSAAPRQAMAAPVRTEAAGAARPAPPVRPSVSDEQVRLCAYLKWVAAGRPPGDGVRFWLEAERELRVR